MTLEKSLGFEEATIFTIAKVVIFAMAIIAQKTFYRMMKRLPGRAINEILYSHMVSVTGGPHLMQISLHRKKKKNSLTFKQLS